MPEQRMTQGLYLDMRRMPGSDFYNPRSAFRTELAGIELEYQLVPNTFLDRHGYGTRLGFREEGKTFVSRHLKEAQMPVVALFLHLKSLDTPEIAAALGVEQDKFEGLNDYELHDVLLSATLEYASDFLRPNDVNDLIKTFKEEPGYDPAASDSLFERFSKGYLSDQSVDALVRRSTTQLELYTERAADHIRRFADSTYNRRMDNLHRIVTEYRGMNLIFGNEVTKARNTYRIIKDSPQLSAMIPETVELLTKLINNAEANTLILADATASGILYLCSAAYIDSRKPPVIFLDTEVEKQGDNWVEITPYGINQFLPSLKRLLMQDVIRELDELDKSLEGLEDVVTGVQKGDRDALSIAGDYVKQLTSTAQTGIALTGAGAAAAIQKKVEAPAKEYRTTLAFIATGGTDAELAVFQAAQALGTLARLGIPVSREQTQAVGEIEKTGKLPAVPQLTDGRDDSEE
ncbi:MAG: hypothetical protein ABIG89_00560 [Candidatus Woesearchaeota archaeon]